MSASGLTFKKVKERARVYTFAGGEKIRVDNVVAICIRPTNHRLETRDGRKFVIPGKFLAIEIDADGWSL
ncbi:hypothetical protein [Stenotrophomonas maltophilia]|uniref:hypothetical protein n=1 Tax=Stenotrophomonas maltophilia TaxID=40324 RepID=UPI002090A7E2|nr:hypothetical protein [Stenotrophomonas maltophilia]MCO5735936.1 hypothetical protein [Stenotrophomonas maltophilia]